MKAKWMVEITDGGLKGQKYLCDSQETAQEITNLIHELAPIGEEVASEMSIPDRDAIKQYEDFTVGLIRMMS